MSPKIHAEFWTDPDLEEVEPEVRLALLWMITNPMTDLTGSFEVAPKRFSFETGLEGAFLEAALQALPRMFVRSGSRVWLRTFIKHQFGRGAKLSRNTVGRAVANAVWDLPEELRVAVWGEYPELRALGVGKGMGGGTDGDGKGMGGGTDGDGKGMGGGTDGDGKGKDLPGLGSVSGSLPVDGIPMASPPHGVRTEQNRTEQSRTESGEGSGEGPSGLPMGEGPSGLPMGEGRAQLRWDLAKECLDFLNAEAGTVFPESHAVLHEIALRVHEVRGDVAGIKKMVARQAGLWRGSRMAEFLRPATLFESVKFHNYWGQRELPAGGSGPGGLERRKWLEEQVGTSRANKGSVYHSGEATEQERADLKKWRAELAGLNV